MYITNKCDRHWYCGYKKKEFQVNKMVINQSSNEIPIFIIIAINLVSYYLYKLTLIFIHFSHQIRININLSYILFLYIQIKTIKFGHQSLSHQPRLQKQMQYQNIFDYQLSNQQSASSKQNETLSIINQSSAEYWTNTSIQVYRQLWKQSEQQQEANQELICEGDQYEKKQRKSSLVKRVWDYVIESDKENTNDNIVDAFETKKKTKFSINQTKAGNCKSIGKIQLFRQLKMLKIFKAWKKQCKNSGNLAQIQEQQEQLKQQLKLKFNCFKEWKITTVVEKRAKQFYAKKIYRAFFMTCSTLLQTRLRSIYLEEILKLNRFPKLMTKLRQNLQAKQKQQEKFIMKMKLKIFVSNSKQNILGKNIEKLSNLNNQFRLKRKSWKVLLRLIKKRKCV